MRRPRQIQARAARDDDRSLRVWIASITPAVPGTVAVWCNVEDDEDDIEVWTEPVHAWALLEYESDEREPYADEGPFIGQQLIGVMSEWDGPLNVSSTWVLENFRDGGTRVVTYAHESDVPAKLHEWREAVIGRIHRDREAAIWLAEREAKKAAAKAKAASPNGGAS